MKYLTFMILTTIFYTVYLSAHASQNRSAPVNGSTVSSPESVKIWFDSTLENAFHSIQVKDASGKRVDKNDVKVVDSNTLEVGLSELKPGAYTVNWTAVARDGHPTKGHFNFNVK